METHLVLYFFLFLGTYSVEIKEDERKDVAHSKDTSTKQYLEILKNNISNYKNSKLDRTSSYIPEYDLPKYDVSKSDFPKSDASQFDFRKYDIERSEIMKMVDDINEQDAEVQKMNEDFNKALEEEVRKKEERKKEKYMVKIIITLVAFFLFGVAYFVEKYILKCTKCTKSDDEEKILGSSQSDLVQPGSFAPQGV